MIDTITNWLANNLEISSDLLGKIIGTAVIIIFLLLLRPLVTALVSRRTEDITTLYRWRKVSEYAALILGLYLIGRVWITGSQSLATYLGLLSAGLAIALQDPIANFVGWIFIVWRRPLEIGDRIEIGDHAGDVIDIRFFQFSLMEIRAWVGADQSTILDTFAKEAKIEFAYPTQRIYYQPVEGRPLQRLEQMPPLPDEDE